MLKFNLHPFLKIRRVLYPRRLLINLKINPVSATRLLRGELNSLKLAHVEKICLALCCTPNDLLEWTPDKTFVDDGSHPIHKIAPRRNIDRLLNKPDTLSYEEIGRLMTEEE